MANTPTGTAGTTGTTTPQILHGDGTWSFTLTVDGDDLVTTAPVLATWFGGDSDSMDSGETACGYPTKGHPSLLGCALPMHGYGEPHTEGSPVPRMPFGLHADGTNRADGAHVRVWSPKTNKDITVPVIDLGPGKQASTPGHPHGIDLTRQAFRALGLDPAVGVAEVRYRILGGARYVGK
jgi:hypothetical protein